ncbi:MAG: hypothetical protein ABW095_08785 [Candidatus Thiodiazotropha sp.]
MIKAIESLKDHPLRDAIMARFEVHPEFPTFCRFRLSELKRLAGIESRMFMKDMNSCVNFSNSLTQYERSEINILQRYTRKSKLEGLERRHKSAVQRTERFISSITETIEAEEALKADWLALQNKRSAAGLGEPLKAMEERFK